MPWWVWGLILVLLMTQDEVRGGLPVLSLPLASPFVYVNRGWDSLPTHMGAWRYGWDFMAVASPDAWTRRHVGLELTDYASWGATVTAPVGGLVVAAENNEMDIQPYTLNLSLPPGPTSRGNFVLLQYTPRLYALVAHLQRGSVTVRVGQAIAQGTALGRVGNSGYTLEPHVHFQVQSGPDKLAATVAVDFAGRVPRSGELLRR